MVLIFWFILLLIWLFLVYSVSIYKSFQLTLLINENPTNYFYTTRHIFYLLLGLIIWFIVYKIPLWLIEKNKYKIFLFSLFLQLLVFTPLWLNLKWASWWIKIPYLTTLQPAEIFKLWYIIFLSWWLLKKQKIIWTLKWFILFSIINVIFFSIFLKIPDLWTLLVLWPVAAIMYWYAWWKLKYLLIWWFLWLLILFTIWMQFNYIKQRLNFFLNPEIDESWRWIAWQTKQALIAIWAWWFFWQWYWKWLQKFWYIPEAYSDFIFAAAVEEIWFIWWTVIILLYLWIAAIWLLNINKVKNEYYKILWIWIISLIFIQAFINIWVNIKILPITWLTLPLISYWWTSIIVNIILIVLLHKILKWQ